MKKMLFCLGISSLFSVLLLTSKKQMDKQDSNIVNDLLPRYCEGEVSDEERRLVEAWTNLSEENYRIAKQIHTIYLATETTHVLERIDTERALAKVTLRMSDSRKKTWVGWLQRIAAVLFIPVLIVLLIQNFESKPKLVQMIEVRTNPGMTTTFNLPDGSIVHLNSESSLSYPSHFDKNIRNVTLAGEAYFSVSEDKNKRFIVSLPHQARIEVLGTEFNVEAFDKDTFVSTTLIQGKVNFLFGKEDVPEAVVLKPGQKLVYVPKYGQTQLLTTTGLPETAWKDGRIVFSDTPLKQALRMLEKRYNVEFVVTNSRFDEDSFTGSFKHQHLDRILELFRISSKIRWRYIESSNFSGEKTKIEIY